MIKTIATINGMGCGMCEANMRDALEKNFAVKTVKVNRKKNMAEIISQEPIDQAKLSQVVTAAGFTLADVTTEDNVKKGLFR